MYGSWPVRLTMPVYHMFEWQTKKKNNQYLLKKTNILADQRGMVFLRFDNAIAVGKTRQDF